MSLPFWLDRDRASMERCRIRRYYPSAAALVAGATTEGSQTTASAFVDDGTTLFGAPRHPGTFLYTTGPNEFGEIIEFFNSDIFGYIGGLDAFDSMLGYANYLSMIVRTNLIVTPSAGTKWGLYLGKVVQPNPTADLNEVCVGLEYDLSAAIWRAVINNKWAAPGSRFYSFNLGADGGVGAAAPSNVNEHRLEIVWDPAGIADGMPNCTFLINGKTALRLTDDLCFPLAGQMKPIRQIYENRQNAGSTKTGMHIFLRQGAGAGNSSIRIDNVHAETLVREQGAA